MPNDGGYNSSLAFSTTTGTTLNEKMRILSNGRVGIGWTNPLDNLDVKSAGRAGLRLSNGSDPNWYSTMGGRELEGGTHSSDLQLKSYNNYGGIYPFSMSFWTGGTSPEQRMTVDNSGKVGIGTTSPSNKLTVSHFGDGASVNNLLRIEQYNPGSPVSGTGVGIEMAIGDNYNMPSVAGKIRTERSNYSNSSMIFSTALANSLSDRMVIDPNGNVGIGANQPTSYYHGGNKKVLELLNSNTSPNSQSHLILSTGATSAGSSAGTISWMTKNSTNFKGLACIAAITIGDQSTNATGKLVFLLEMHELLILE